MDCAEALDRLSAADGTPVPGLPTHLEACPACRGVAGRLARLDLLGREALAWEGLVPVPALPRRTGALRWVAAAALLLLTITLAWRREEGTRPAPTPIAPTPGLEILLEPAEGARLRREGALLFLESGTCWVALGPATSLELAGPLPLLLTPGTQAELRIDRAPAALLLREASAATGPVLLVSIVSGEARAGTLAIPAGIRARLEAGRDPVLEPLGGDALAAIDAWRSRRLEAAASERRHQGLLSLQAPAFLPLGSPACFTAGVRRVTGHLVLRYPLAGGFGETTLGGLPAWGDGAWHRVSVRSGPAGAEIFLDGRRLLAVPPAKRREGKPEAGLGVRGGSLEVEDVRAGPETPR